MGRVIFTSRFLFQNHPRGTIIFTIKEGIFPFEPFFYSIFASRASSNSERSESINMGMRLPKSLNPNKKPNGNF